MARRGAAARSPDGSRHRVDLVAKLRTLEPADPDAPDAAEWLALVHIEVEATDRTTGIKPRLPGYYLYLTERYGLPVLPIVLYLSVGLDGLGTDAVVRRFWDFEVLRMQYLYVGLPALDAEQYIRGDNWLGVALAALMRFPKDRISELGLEALRRIGGAELNEQKRYLLDECVEAYLPVETGELDRLRSMIPVSAGGKSMATLRRNVTSYDIGIDKARAEGRAEGRMAGLIEGHMEGRDEGRALGQVELLEALLETRFGKLPAESLAKLREVPDDRLKPMAIALTTAKSLAELGL